MYQKSSLSKQFARALLAIGLTAASSAFAAPATLSTTVTGPGWGGTANHIFGTLPQGVDYTLTTTLNYDSDFIQNDNGVDIVWGDMVLTLTAGDVTLEYATPQQSASYLAVRLLQSDNADGYSNELLMYNGFTIDNGGNEFEVWQSIRWKDGTAAPVDFLRTPQQFAWGDDYRIESNIVARQSGEWLGYVDVAAYQGSVTVSLVPEPSQFGMLAAGLVVGAAALRRRRAAERART